MANSNSNKMYSSRTGYKRPSRPNNNGCDTGEKYLIVEADMKHSRIIDKGDCTYLHISGSGDIQVIDANPNIEFTDNCDGTFSLSWKDEDPVTIDVCKAVAAGCNATIVVNPDYSFTFTDNAGNSIVVPPPQPSKFSITDGGIIVHEDGAGEVVVYDLCQLVADNCSGGMVDNGDGSFTHTNIAGDVVIIPAPPVSSVVNNGNGSYTFDDGSGTSTVIDVNEIDMDINSVVAAGSVITFTSEDGSTVDLDVCEIVANNCNSTLTFNADGSLVYTDNAGAVTNIPAPTESTFVDNGDGTYTHTSGSGVSVTTAPPVSSSLVDNGDGTYTHTDVDGNVVNIDTNDGLSSQIVDNGDGTYTHTSDNGNETLIDICQAVAANCNANIRVDADGNLVHTDNAGVETVIPAATPPSQLVDNGDGTYTHTSGDGTVQDIVDTDTTYDWVAVTDPDTGVVTHTMTSSDGSTYDLVACPTCGDDDHTTNTIVDNCFTTVEDPAGDTTIVQRQTPESGRFEIEVKTKARAGVAMDAPDNAMFAGSLEYASTPPLALPVLSDCRAAVIDVNAVTDRAGFFGATGGIFDPGGPALLGSLIFHLSRNGGYLADTALNWSAYTGPLDTPNPIYIHGGTTGRWTEIVAAGATPPQFAGHLTYSTTQPDDVESGAVAGLNKTRIVVSGIWNLV